MTAPAALRPYDSLLRPSRGRPGAPYAVYPGLARPRWLVPAGAAPRRTVMAFASRGGLREMARGALVAFGLLRGDRIWLDVAPLAETLAGVLGAPVGPLLFYVGTQGAYRKLTVRVTTRDGTVSAYAKIAGHVLACEALEREHAVLVRLGQVPVLRGSVPEVLGWLPRGDLSLLVLSTGPARRGPRSLGARHVEFLRRLWEATREERPFRESAMWARIVATVDCLSPRMPAPWPHRYGRALDRLDRRVGRTALPLGFAHRDFAPWNTAVGARGLFVFDWEAAEDGMTPLYDVFHFGAIQAALHGGRRGVSPRARAVGDLLGLPAGAPLEALYGAYLVDMSLFYTEARVLAPDAGDDQVWRWLGAELDAWTEGGHGAA